MSDGRLFTEFNPTCSNSRQQMIQKGEQYRSADRSTVAMRAGTNVCADTMVPELYKRMYRWDGPVGQFVSHPAGIGTGRMYLPGRPDLITGDPDALAAATCPFWPNTTMTQQCPVPKVQTVRNRYSAPYGN